MTNAGQDTAGGAEPPVRLGVLLVDSFDEQHRSVSGDYDRLYGDLFARAGATVDLYDARALDRLPDATSADGWMIGGSRQSVGDDLPWLARLHRWLGRTIDAEVPVIGICFGHQLVAAAAGAEVGRWQGGWNIGAVDYALVPGATSHLGAGTGSFRLLASHRDQVLTAPAGAEVFATAPTCPIAGFTIGDHVTCVQGHPEFTPALATSLYRSRIGLIGEEPVAAALASLERPCDGDSVAAWMVDRVALAHR